MPKARIKAEVIADMLYIPLLNKTFTKTEWIQVTAAEAAVIREKLPELEIEPKKEEKGDER